MDEPRRHASEWPDLLHDGAQPWGELSGAEDFVRFAYEGGDCEGIFDGLIERTPLARSTFDPAAFAGQLHLEELLRECFRIEIGGRRYEPSLPWLERVISVPPAERGHVGVRQEVLDELVAKPKLRAELERLFLALHNLRKALEAGRIEEPSSVRRKLGVLSALRECIDAMSDGFEGAESGLVQLRSFGTSVAERESFQRLAQMLDYDDHLATVDVRLRLGADGTIRAFAITTIHENTSNALLPGPASRFLQRLLGWLRGYRFGESEVVLRLLDVLFSPLVEVIVGSLRLNGAIELYLAALGFRDYCLARRLTICLPQLVENEIDDGEVAVSRRFEALFNPLLFLQDIVPIPCDLPAARCDELTIVTGPNSGGKTRLLQAIALAQCLGQAGLFVPASRACLVRAPNLFVSLVIEQDAAQKEGRLGTELLRIRHLFESLEPGTLAILDELCSGTNPMEGEAIFEMVVSLLPALRPQVFISTHFLSLAARLQHTPPVEGLAFLEVALDPDELPTFGFVPGVAKTSLAHKVAERLGVTRGHLEKLVADKRKRQGD